MNNKHRRRIKKDMKITKKRKIEIRNLNRWNHWNVRKEILKEESLDEKGIILINVVYYNNFDYKYILC